MEDDEKVRYVLLLGVIAFIYQGPMTDLFKWVTLIGALLILLTIAIFAIDGIFLNVIPDRILKLLAWLGILLATLILMIWWLSLPEYLNLTLP